MNILLGTTKRIQRPQSSTHLFIIGITALCLGMTSCNDKSATATGANQTETANSQLDLNLYIQGYYTAAGMMTPVKMNQGIGADASLVDNITVELRKSTGTHDLVASGVADLKTDGTATLSLTHPVGSYYIVIKYRNALETWSASPISFTGTSVTYNFTSSASQAYGSRQIAVAGGYFALYNGDVNQDGTIDSDDIDLWTVDYDAFASGDFATDLNGDGSVDMIDYTLYESNMTNGISVSRP